MLSGRKRWLVYILVGLAFGLLDWYYLDLLAHFPWGDLGNNPLVVPIILLLNFGIWLVPLVPITYHESRISGTAINPALAGALTWSASILSYYAWYTFLLLYRGLPQMDHLLLANSRQPGYREQWNLAFQNIILDQVLEWLPVALVGGAFLGWAVFRLVQRRNPAAAGPTQT